MALIYTFLPSPKITVKASDLDFTPSEVDLQQVHRSVCKIWGDVLNFEQVTNASSNSKRNKYLSRRNFFDFFPLDEVQGRKWGQSHYMMRRNFKSQL